MHEIGRTLPKAYAIIHPMHPEFEYPFKYLCGAGVAYKLSQCLIDLNNRSVFISQ
jgi:single-stranded-DNA-specific exonuclease